MPSHRAGFVLVDCPLASSETARLSASLDKIKTAEILLHKLQSCAASAELSEQLEHIRAQIQPISSLIRMRLQLCVYESRTNDYDHKAILAHSEWTKVVGEAKRAQATLLSLHHDTHEGRALN